MHEIKTYDPKEEKLNVLTHLLGAVLCPAGWGVLLYYAKGFTEIFACTVYAFSLFLMYAGSALYHNSSNPARRALLRKFDHANIYLLISGTYTPMMLICAGGTAGTIILIISWAIAILGITLEMFSLKPFKGVSLILYVISGWLCISIIGHLIRQMTPFGLACLLAGGISYTLGIIFYVRKRLYSHVIWHGFVMAGTLLHYFAVLTLLY